MRKTIDRDEASPLHTVHDAFCLCSIPHGPVQETRDAQRIVKGDTGGSSPRCCEDSKQRGGEHNAVAWEVIIKGKYPVENVSARFSSYEKLDKVIGAQTILWTVQRQINSPRTSKRTLSHLSTAFIA